MSTTSVLVPLSSVDCRAGVESLLSVFCYVLAGRIDSDVVRDAALRVIEKWRLLAGRIERGDDTYNVRVPTGTLDEDEPRLHFTTCLSSSPLPTAVEPLDETSACTIAPPAYGFFVDKDTSGSLAAMSTSGAPILNIHIHSFADYTCTYAPATRDVLLTLAPDKAWALPPRTESSTE